MVGMWKAERMALASMPPRVLRPSAMTPSMMSRAPSTSGSGAPTRARGLHEQLLVALIGRKKRHGLHRHAREAEVGHPVLGQQGPGLRHLGAPIQQATVACGSSSPTRSPSPRLWSDRSGPGARVWRARRPRSDRRDRPPPPRGNAPAWCRRSRPPGCRGTIGPAEPASSVASVSSENWDRRRLRSTAQIRRQHSGTAPVGDDGHPVPGQALAAPEHLGGGEELIHGVHLHRPARSMTARKTSADPTQAPVWDLAAREPAW